MDLNLISTEEKVVKTISNNSQSIQLYVSGLPPGIYILKIESTESVVLKRVVIQ